MDKLMITCATDWVSYQGISGLNAPATSEEIAKSVAEARDAGACITHVHEPLSNDSTRSYGFHVEAWQEVARLVREKSDIIFEHGLGGVPYAMFQYSTNGSPSEKQQVHDMNIERPELISVLLNHVDFMFGQRQSYTLPTREELDRFIRRCGESMVKPSFEVWHSGSYFNLQWLIDQGIVKPPYWLTLFFGARGAMSGRATIDELLYRIKTLPENTLWQVSVFSGPKGATTREQMNLVTQAIILGGHVRVGMEDNPYYWDGVPAKSNAQLVERVVRIARELGREVVEPNEARQILGVPGR